MQAVLNASIAGRAAADQCVAIPAYVLSILSLRVNVGWHAGETVYC
jgi:hypothetical protein